MNTSVLSIHKGQFSFNHKAVLKDINLNINQGEFVGIIGPNGAGKSTLLRILAGILKMRSGVTELLGQDITTIERKVLARQLAYVPQTVEMAFSFQVREVLQMGRYPWSKGIIEEDLQGERIIDEALLQLDLKNFQHRPYGSLSGGEKQRAIIASALVQQASIFLLDEPTSALDLKHQQMILEYLTVLQNEQDRTIILVTHDINLAAQFCKRLILINDGAIVADGKPDEVLQFSLIQDVYGVKVYIDINPFTDSLYILPYGKAKSE